VSIGIDDRVVDAGPDLGSPGGGHIFTLTIAASRLPCGIALASSDTEVAPWGMPNPTAEVITRQPLAAFGYGPTATVVEMLPGGHIHANFLVTTMSGRIVPQRLTTYVLAGINLLLSNAERVANHFGVGGWPTPPLVETRQGAHSSRSGDGSTWRALRYLEGQNLDQCRTQLRLTELLPAAYAEVDACFRQPGAGRTR
jgi:hypothetical protein